ncbi:MAG: efflux RND transporter periplasmic adaptor subunit [Acetobacteraceae bacterium]|nr:efflux RND transporter periplasmic adaptor subunit [Acetobacteraceae bacterium]
MSPRLAVLALLLAAPPALAQPRPGGPPAVGVVQAKETAVIESNEFVGRIESEKRVNLVARVVGFLDKRNFTEGAEVREGDLLYVIEQAQYQAQVAQQQAAVASANATLVNNTQTLERAQALIHTPAGQQSLVDNALAQQRSAAAQLASAQAQLRLAQINLDYTEIKAPIDGKITRTAVNVGNVVGPTTGTLATIVSQDPMYVVFPISVRIAIDLRDRYASKGGFGAVVIKLRLPNGDAYGQAGHLDYVDPTIAQGTDTILLRGTIPNPVHAGSRPGTPGDRDLADGEFVTVLLQGVQPVQALAIPRVAVLSDQQGSYVWVVGPGNKVEQRRVSLGQSTPGQAVISAGLKEGETVIVDGVQRARPGLVVNPGPASPQPSLAPQGPNQGSKT